MDTKWRNIIDNMTGNIKCTHVRNVMMAAALILTAVFTSLSLSGVPYEYNPGFIITAFVSGVLSIVLMVQTVLAWFDSRYNSERYDKYYKRLKMLAIQAQVVPLIYTVLLSCILCMVRIDEYSDSLMGNLLSYRMDWIVIALYCLPVLSLELSLIMGISKRQEKLILNMNMVTEEAVAESLKNERLKIDLITNVSHDLKTPLTSITGYLELLKKEELSGTASDYVDVLSVKAGILKEMIEKLFDLAKVSSGNIELNIERLDLNRMVKQITADLDDVIVKSNKTVKLELTDQDTAFAADSSYMYRICQNLFENAMKYSMDGTRIFVRTRCEDKRVILEIVNVANYQMDFDKNTIKERFARADKSRTTEGNGLGLAIVETYTNALKGRFDIEVDGDIFKAVLSFEQ